jgi:two-component system, chemotaxis family, chemotaxis protein CheY
MADASLRRARRVGVDLPVTIAVATPSRLFSVPRNIEIVAIPTAMAGEKFEGHIVNLSPNGAFIALEGEVPPLLARLEIDFELESFGAISAAALVMRRVSPQPGQGSTPHPDSPRGIGVLFADMPIDARQAVAGFIQARRNAGRRALVVDDSPGIRALLADALRQLGTTETVEVTEADGGMAALKLIERERFDIIITDLHMAEFDGFKLMSYLRASEMHRTVPIIAVTSDSDPGVRERALSLGANLFLQKPLQRAKLYNAMRQLLGV